MYSTSCESQLTARPLALVAIDDALPCPYGCRDVTDGALGSSEEGQGARSTSSGGDFLLEIHRMGPYPTYGGPGPVTGASTGRQGRLGNPSPVEQDQ